ncbi:MAG: response regulator transcription factor [Alphaproteobacteria bacterium]|nr:response regulator transcription factor [Alphaproteobacteria bacterium]MDE1985485.1 response regulator transcription factor [Alphaproteobacteria bacterium]MDE2161578.1 response regulator transcription factor [Alphaproteobacteria bacterium]MDE2264617.1 response regulator transcription factor [Alphaproteobacteria bacterium]MDE2498815.1 response regulator transcription factor [Alphaproteobacteria bacterium]
MSSAKRVLLVEDDDMLRTSLAEQLSQESDCMVVEAADCASARRMASEGLYEFMILDVGLPDGDGRTLCRDFRGQGITCPILLLTAADTDHDAIEGLDSGANDYVTKPFRFAVLMARVHAHLRSHGRSEEAMYRIGPYTFRPSAKLLLEGDSRKIRLTEKETNILKYLYRCGDTVPRETLLHEVWGYNPAVTTHTLETHIYRLRQKIELNPGEARILVTESGGYRLMA